MGSEIIRTGVAIVTAIVGLAVLSVLVSKNATTPALIQNLSSGLAQDINAATSPVTSAGGLGMIASPTFAQSSPTY